MSDENNENNESNGNGIESKNSTEKQMQLYTKIHIEETKTELDENDSNSSNTSGSGLAEAPDSVCLHMGSHREYLNQLTIEQTQFSNERLTYATNKNIAEGMMDIALLSANANQLRFLITYNREASFFYISLVLVIVSLILQLTVGIGLLIRRRWRLKSNGEPHKTNTFIVGGVFVVTMVNILLAALTTTDNNTTKLPNEP